MEDLDEHMLTQIFLRLDSCTTVFVCRAVNKHWCSLISDPRFGSQFSNHKKKRISPKLSVGDTRDRKRKQSITVPWESEEPAWTFITSMKDKKQNVWRVGNASSNEAVFGSPKFSLEYLPCRRFTIDATFMDLVLCSDEVDGARQGRVYYITNPLTKQWVALPRCPFGYWKPWAALICQHPRDDYYSQDYKFRVVLVHNVPPRYTAFRELVVYCSEIGEWKKIDVNVTSSKKYKPEIGESYSFMKVVCNGVIYLNHYLGLAAFNPLDVDQTTTDIEAKLLPSLPVVGGFLRECSGQLFVIYNDRKCGIESTSYVKVRGDH